MSRPLALQTFVENSPITYEVRFEAGNDKAAPEPSGTRFVEYFVEDELAAVARSPRYEYDGLRTLVGVLGRHGRRREHPDAIRVLGRVRPGAHGFRWNGP
ncbi:MAG: hypothetical protein IPG81_18070 [Sandaracinaceae bacterium]|nr:hypothetical protein [Sandaracinaceae bacterium]